MKHERSPRHFQAKPHFDAKRPLLPTAYTQEKNLREWLLLWPTLLEGSALLLEIHPHIKNLLVQFLYHLSPRTILLGHPKIEDVEKKFW